MKMNHISFPLATLLPNVVHFFLAYYGYNVDRWGFPQKNPSLMDFNHAICWTFFSFHCYVDVVCVACYQLHGMCCPCVFFCF